MEEQELIIKLKSQIALLEAEARGMVQIQETLFDALNQEEGIAIIAVKLIEIHKAKKSLEGLIPKYWSYC